MADEALSNATFSAVGRRISVYLPAERKSVPGLIVKFDPTKDAHTVRFDRGGDEETLFLNKERFKWLVQPGVASDPQRDSRKARKRLDQMRSLIGRRVEIKSDKSRGKCRSGRIIQYDEATGRHKVRYDDNNKSGQVRLEKGKFRWLDTICPDHSGSSKITSVGASRFLGVQHSSESRWMALGPRTKGGRPKDYIGTFTSEKDAALAHDVVARKFGCPVNFESEAFDEDEMKRRKTKQYEGITPPVRGRSNYRGVHWQKNRKRWMARYSHNTKGRKHVNLGAFLDAKHAALAFDAEARRQGRPREALNFPDEAPTAEEIDSWRTNSAHYRYMRSGSAKSSQYRGVTSPKPQKCNLRRPWIAQVNIGKVLKGLGAEKGPYQIGRYPEEKQAALAFDRICRKYGVAETELNFPRNARLAEVRLFDDECYLCHKESPNNPVAVPCNHVFCRRCIISWLAEVEGCPCCQAAMTSEVELRPVDLVPWPKHEPNAARRSSPTADDIVSSDSDSDEEITEEKKAAGRSPIFFSDSDSDAEIIQRTKRKRTRKVIDDDSDEDDSNGKASGSTIGSDSDYNNNNTVEAVEEGNSVEEELEQQPRKRQRSSKTFEANNAVAARAKSSKNSAPDSVASTDAANELQGNRTDSYKDVEMDVKSNSDDDRSSGSYDSVGQCQMHLDLSAVRVGDRVAFDFDGTTHFGAVIDLCFDIKTVHENWRWEVKFDDGETFEFGRDEMTEAIDTYKAYKDKDLEGSSSKIKASAAGQCQMQPDLSAVKVGDRLAFDFDGTMHYGAIEHCFDRNSDQKQWEWEVTFDDGETFAFCSDEMAEALTLYEVCREKEAEDPQHSSKVKAYAERFEAERKWVLSRVPKEVKSQFRQIGFAKWNGKYDSFLPVLYLGPYDVSPGPLRDQWMKSFKKMIDKGHNNVPRLVYWYGSKNLQEAFSILSGSRCLSYDEGVKKGFHTTPEKIAKKIKSGTLLSSNEIFHVRAMEAMKEDVPKCPRDRVHFPKSKEDYEMVMDGSRLLMEIMAEADLYYMDQPEISSSMNLCLQVEEDAVTTERSGGKREAGPTQASCGKGGSKIANEASVHDDKQKALKKAHDTEERKKAKLVCRIKSGGERTKQKPRPKDSKHFVGPQKKSFLDSSPVTGAQKQSRTPPKKSSRVAATDIGPGWTMESVERMGGTMKGQVDKYWFSPQTKKKLRSMAEVQRFKEALLALGGDEDKAWKKTKEKSKPHLSAAGRPEKPNEGDIRTTVSFAEGRTTEATGLKQGNLESKKKGATFLSAKKQTGEVFGTSKPGEGRNVDQGEVGACSGSDADKKQAKQPRVPPKEISRVTATDIGPGWTMKSFKRMGGTRKGQVDKYWCSPQTEKKLRSMAEIRKFKEALLAVGGDEDKAWKVMKETRRGNRKEQKVDENL